MALNKPNPKITATIFAGRVHPWGFRQWGQMRASLGIIIAHLGHFFLGLCGSSGLDLWGSGFFSAGIFSMIIEGDFIGAPHMGHLSEPCGIGVSHPMHFFSAIRPPEIKLY
jgi:hypothetical protein